jgi:hypothetical protein
MCLCWDFDEKGNVTGLCSTEELARRIHDPNFRPELKDAKNKGFDEMKRKQEEHFKSLSEERKEELRQSWVKTIKR